MFEPSAVNVVPVVVKSGAVTALFVAVLKALAHGLVANAWLCCKRFVPVPFNTSVCPVIVVNVPAAGVVPPMTVLSIVPPVIATALAFWVDIVPRPVIPVFGILVKLAPEPLNTVAAKVPVDGTKDSFVELVVAGLLPLEFTDKTG